MPAVIFQQTNNDEIPTGEFSAFIWRECYTVVDAPVPLAAATPHVRGLLFSCFSFLLIFILYIQSECKIVKQLDILSVAFRLPFVHQCTFGTFSSNKVNY